MHMSDLDKAICRHAEGTPPEGHHLLDALSLDKRRQTFSGESGTETAQVPFEVISCPKSGQVVAMGGVAKKIP